MKWTPVRVRLSQLQPWAKNPRRLSKKHAERLLKSWQEFGQAQTIAIGPNYEVYDGHQRLNVLRAAYGDDYEVLALQCDTELDDRQRARLTALLNGAASGEWDVEQLRKLLDQEFSTFFDSEDASAASRLAKHIRKEISLHQEHYPYVLVTSGILYEPTGRKVSVQDLFDKREYEQKLALVEQADVSDEEREFLRLAATRYVDFHFANIAEYYTRASAQFQRVAEALGLVIVDADDAIKRAIFAFDERFRNLVRDNDAQ